jgi:hypothetical protein
MTTPTAPNTPDPSLAARLNMMQAMQSLLAMPPSADLKALVEVRLKETTDPVYKGFLNLLVTDNQAHRDLAAQIFHGLEAELTSQRGEEVAEAAQKADELIEASRVSQPAIAVEEPANDVPAAPEPPVLSGADIPMTMHWLSHKSDEEVYDLKYSDANNNVTKIERYGILTSYTRFAQPAEQELKSIRAVIIGVAGQTSIAHGFGFVLPIADNLAPSFKDGRVYLPMRLEYPTAIPLYDDHNATQVPGLKDFLAIHDVMSRGYTFLLDLHVRSSRPTNDEHGLLLSCNRNMPIVRRAWNEKERHYEADGAVFHANDLEDLRFATRSLTLIGVLADGFQST